LRSPQISLPYLGAFVLLCLLWALGSLRRDLFPGTVSYVKGSPLLNQAATFGLFAVVLAVIASLRKENWPRGRTLVNTALVGAGLFSLPGLLIELAQSQIHDSARVALFSLVPVFAVVTEPWIVSRSEPPRGGLIAALVAVAGTLLLFPVDVPQSPLSALAFVGVIVAAFSVAAANCAAVAIVRHQSRLSLCTFGVTVAGSAAVFLVFTALLLGQPFSFSPHCDVWDISDLLALGLLFFLMRRISAVRMTTRFLFAPLFANMIALVFLRPAVEASVWLSLLLIVVGAGWLLLAPEEEPAESSPLLGIHRNDPLS
jgi:drug/metabolite transporter (DMT)-like permease